MARYDEEELSPELQALVDGVGGVADRAQSALDPEADLSGADDALANILRRETEERRLRNAVGLSGAPGGESGSGPASFVGKSVMGAAPSSWQEMTPEEQEKVLAVARQKAQMNASLSKAGRGFQRAADLVRGVETPHVQGTTPDYEGQAEDRIKRAQEFVRAKKAEEEKATAAKRQAAIDELNRRKTEADIAKAMRPEKDTPQQELDYRAALAEEARARAEALRNGSRRPRGVGAGPGGAGGAKDAPKPDPKVAAKMTEVQERYNNIKQQIENLKTSVEQKGTYDLVGPHNQLMEQSLNSIATDMAKLVDPDSVARESEVEAFKKMLFKPSLWTRNDTALDVLKGFGKMVDDRIGNAYKVRGLQMPGTQNVVSPPSGSPVEAAGEEMVPMISPTGEPRMVPKSKVQAAIAKGGKVAQ